MQSFIILNSHRYIYSKYIFITLSMPYNIDETVILMIQNISAILLTVDRCNYRQLYRNFSTATKLSPMMIL